MTLSTQVPERAFRYAADVATLVTIIKGGQLCPSHAAHSLYKVSRMAFKALGLSSGFQRSDKRASSGANIQRS